MSSRHPRTEFPMHIPIERDARSWRGHRGALRSTTALSGLFGTLPMLVVGAGIGVIAARIFGDVDARFDKKRLGSLQGTVAATVLAV